MGILECKIKPESMDFLMRSTFLGWSQCNNFGVHSAGYILVLWRPGAVEIDAIDILAQWIHMCVTYKVTSRFFIVTFIYGFNTIVARREL